jgi:hypothetical protein
VGLLFLVLTLVLGGFGLSVAAGSDEPRGAYTYTVEPNEYARPPELWPKRSTHNAPHG